MWEYRVLWAEAPPWWDWNADQELPPRPGLKREQRPDLYLALEGREDLGLKLRGENEKDFDVKVLHDRRGGWERWEKVPFFRWDDLEAIRLAALLRVPPPAGAYEKDISPSLGAREFLSRAGIRVREVKVEKTRLQGSAIDLLPMFADRLGSAWLGELARIEVPDRAGYVYSACVEAMDPTQGWPEPIPAAGGLCAGYPELLLRPNGDALEGAPPAVPAATPSEGLKDYLLAEQERLGEALYRNEEIGERRVQFFTGLVTSVYGGFALLATAEKGSFYLRPDLVMRVVLGGSLFLLLVGFLTYDRVLRRDEVREQYKQALDAIRECFLQPTLAGSPAPQLIARSIGSIRTVGASAPRQKEIGRLGRLMLLLNALIAGSTGVAAFVLHYGWPDDAPSTLKLALLSLALVGVTAWGQTLWWRKHYGRPSPP